MLGCDGSALSTVLNSLRATDTNVEHIYDY